MLFDDSFRAMGTEVNVEVNTSTPPIDAVLSVRLLFESQEALFSRFRSTSLLSRLNRGERVEHSRFATACRCAIEAHEFTGGVFNPMVLPALVDSGYDRTFGAVTGGRPRAQPVPDPRVCLAIHGDAVRLRNGAIDLGGIVKGWTVDLAIAFLRDRVDDALVNAGGDLRTVGQGDSNGWQIDVESPTGGSAWAGAVDGALATSTSLTRYWLTDAGNLAHHIIDPRSGLPSSGPAAQVSVWGPEAWRAECWAKAILIGGEEMARRAQSDGFAVLALAPDGRAMFGEGPNPSSHPASGGLHQWAPRAAQFGP